MVRASQLHVGFKYDFNNVALDDGSLQRWVDAGEGNWTGWLLRKQNNGDGTWTCFFKDGDNGCDLIVTVDNDYNEFFQRPANRGENFNDIKNKECEEENNNNNNNDENNEDEEGMTAYDIEVGYQYRFENVSLDEGSYQKGIDEGQGNWTGWLLSKEQNDDNSWTCHFKDDEIGCDLWITVDEDYQQFYLVDDTYKEGQALEDIANLICEYDDDENNNSENGEMEENQGGGRHRRQKKRKTAKKSRGPRKTRKGKSAKVRKTKAATKRRKSAKSRKNKNKH